MHPLLAPLCVCALLLPSTLLAAQDPLAKGQGDHVAQVIGWSSDEKRFAVRLYARSQPASPQVDREPEACEGYVNGEGHPFRGSLTVLAYEGGRLLSLFPIQEAGTCTPLTQAQERLNAALKRLEALGIQMGAPAKELLFSPETGGLRVEDGPQAPYTLEYAERLVPQPPKPKQSLQRGVLEQELSVLKGGTRTKVLSRRTPYEYTTAAAGYWRPGLDRLFLSPSGKTLVVMGAERVGNLSGGRKSLRLLGVLVWSGEQLKPL
ncbi:hypothetical protein SAMN05444354_102155 [Stigmatella aurantiaca]|uniref:META domain-containing protein n=1 Tax=Stigmatella aurantiaca TaxID=41 RepID=A0A1H7JCL4_STIAU|nr:hypothetical protein [Stigmatella aurantiaca]SEK71637.1 hypothetical protein SAMN05444354_102155 [Stigmatella aurantiaca]